MPEIITETIEIPKPKENFHSQFSPPHRPSTNCLPHCKNTPPIVDPRIVSVAFQNKKLLWDLYDDMIRIRVARNRIEHYRGKYMEIVCRLKDIDL